MTKIARRRRPRLLPYVSEEMADRVASECATNRVTVGAVVERALRQSFDGTDDKTLLLRRLDRFGRAVTRGNRDLEILSEAFAVFTRLWFAYTPNVPEDIKRGARMTAESHYRQFVQHVAEQFSGGRRFLDDLPREAIANDGELDAIADGLAALPDERR